MIEGLPSIWPYFLIISASFCVAMVWLGRRATQHRLSVSVAMDAALIVMIFGFIGARAFHIIFEMPELYRESPLQILKVWEGGFVWYGGAITGALGAIWYLDRQPEALGRWLDLLAPVCALGYSLGRIACWVQGCCFGRYCELGAHRFQFPTQAFAVFWEAAVVGVLLLLEKKVRPSERINWIQPAGTLFCTWLILHGVGRFIMEFFRGDDRGPTFGNVSISMFLSAALISCGIFYIQRLNSRS